MKEPQPHKASDSSTWTLPTKEHDMERYAVELVCEDHGLIYKGPDASHADILQEAHHVLWHVFETADQGN